MTNVKINKALELIKNHKLKDAINLLTLELLNENNNPNIYHLRAICFQRLSNYNDAKKDFNTALSIKPNFPEALNNLGVLYFTIGENENAIKFFLKSIKQKKDFRIAILGLIKALSHKNNFVDEESIYIKKQHEIHKIEITYSENSYIENIIIKNFIGKVNDITHNHFQNLNFNNTQIYRRTKSDLNCIRHKKVFNTHNVIANFCFGCYKVQVELENIIDLIKLYIIFDNINFKNNNTKKCMVETRKNIKGNYKGLIYCSSLEEAELIKNRLSLLLKINLNKDVICIVKRGCSEFGIKHPEYSNLKDDIMNYNSEWKVFENSIDENYPDLIMKKNLQPSKKGTSLNDVLIIQNWLAYANIIGDETYKSISNQAYQSNYLKNKLNK